MFQRIIKWLSVFPCSMLGHKPCTKFRITNLRYCNRCRYMLTRTGDKLDGSGLKLSDYMCLCVEAYNGSVKDWHNKAMIMMERDIDETEDKT